MRNMPKFYFILLLIVATSYMQRSIAQEELRKQYFKEASEAMNDAKKLNADLYAPKALERGMKAYTEAADDYLKGKNLSDIFEKLKEAIKKFKQASESGKIGEAVFASVHDAQTAATNADALHYATELWNKTEQDLLNAQRDVENGNLSNLKEKAKDLESRYRTAELEAIKGNYLTITRELLVKCDQINVKQYAPRTFQKAQKLLNSVEALLNVNRYDADTARQLASEAHYEATHTMYLYQRIVRDFKEEKTSEDYLLETEQLLQRMMTVMGLLGRFDEGFDKPISSAISAIERSTSTSIKHDEELQKLKEDIRQTTNENLSLSQQVSILKTRLDETEASRHQLERGMIIHDHLATYLHSLDSLFRGDPVIIESESTRIIIRFIGIKIPAYQPTLPGQTTTLLTKVLHVTNLIQNLSIQIEGHNQTQTTPADNYALSVDQANNVEEYLRTMLTPTIHITTTGFGQSRPLPENSSWNILKKNRIDIILIPDWDSITK